MLKFALLLLFNIVSDILSHYVEFYRSLMATLEQLRFFAGYIFRTWPELWCGGKTWCQSAYLCYCRSYIRASLAASRKWVIWELLRFQQISYFHSQLHVLSTFLVFSMFAFGHCWGVLPDYSRLLNFVFSMQQKIDSLMYEQVYSQMWTKSFIFILWTTLCIQPCLSTKIQGRYNHHTCYKTTTSFLHFGIWTRRCSSASKVATTQVYNCQSYGCEKFILLMDNLTL